MLRAGPGLRMREIPPQLALEEIDLRAGELVERLEIVIGRDPRVRDDQDPMLHVIERQHGVEDHESGFVLQRGIRLAIVLQRHRLEPRGRVVAEIADGAAGESRELGNERRGEVGHRPAQHVDELPGRLRRDARFVDDGFAIASPEHDERVFSEKGVSADVLSAFDALEQEGVVGVLGDAQERGYRCQQIGDELLHNGHEGAPLRELGKRLEGGLLHSASNAACLMRPDGGRRPSHHSDWSSAWATSISSPPIVSHPAALASLSSRVSIGL